jgi:Flp pilus assembly protein protease CpaA
VNRLPFFPDAVFGWTFCTVLIILATVAAWSDLRTTKVPNRLTVSILLLGVLGSVLRGGLLAANGMHVWWLSAYAPGAIWLGAVDGLLFSVTGFLVAFIAMFVWWALGLCGGGDVKLFAAIGAWVGAAWFPLVWVVSVVFLIVWMTARIVTGGLSPGAVRKSLRQPNREEGSREPDPSRPAGPGKLRVTYSLPIALATALVLLWVFRVELRLAPPKAQPGQALRMDPHDSLSCQVTAVSETDRRCHA